MRVETEYLVSAKTEAAINRIVALWGSPYVKTNGCSFEDYDTSEIDVMSRVVKLVHQMKVSNRMDEFEIVGGCDTDYDASIFVITYSGEQPYLKIAVANAEDEEERYYQFTDRDYDEIRELLKDSESKTFEQAIESEDDEPFVGELVNMEYNEWIESIIGEYCEE